MKLVASLPSRYWSGKKEGNLIWRTKYSDIKPTVSWQLTDILPTYSTPYAWELLKMKHLNYHSWQHVSPNNLFTMNLPSNCVGNCLQWKQIKQAKPHPYYQRKHAFNCPVMHWETAFKTWAGLLLGSTVLPPTSLANQTFRSKYEAVQDNC